MDAAGNQHLLMLWLGRKDGVWTHRRPAPTAWNTDLDDLVGRQRVNAALREQFLRLPCAGKDLQ